MQRYRQNKIHIGIIMDGNGRWATSRGLARTAGHEAGVKAIRPVVEAAAGANVGTLTLYAFSSDNWKRPKPEVAALMALMRLYLAGEVSHLVEHDVRLTVIGRRDRLPTGLSDRIAEAETATARCAGLNLRIAYDYSAREAILAAAKNAGPDTSHEAFSRLVTGSDTPDVDLLIRTGGEQRLSDFLLWESAYAELVFSQTMWPDFGPPELAHTLAEFQGRDRRFGGLADLVAA